MPTPVTPAGTPRHILLLLSPCDPPVASELRVRAIFTHYVVCEWRIMRSIEGCCIVPWCGARARQASTNPACVLCSPPPTMCRLRATSCGWSARRGSLCCRWAASTSPSTQASSPAAATSWPILPSLICFRAGFPSRWRTSSSRLALRACGLHAFSHAAHVVDGFRCRRWHAKTVQCPNLFHRFVSILFCSLYGIMRRLHNVQAGGA